MKKSLITVILALILSLTLQAQSRIGAHLTSGIITSKVQSGYNSNVKAYASHSLSYMKSTPVIGAGITFQHKAGWVFVQPSLAYSQFKTTLEVRDFNDFSRAVQKGTEEQSRIDLNVTTGLNLNKLRIGFGPTFHWATSFDHQLEKFIHIDERQRKLSTGFTASIGLDLKPISIDIRYEKAFTSFADHVFINNAKTLLRAAPNQLSISIAYMLST